MSRKEVLRNIPRKRMSKNGENILKSQLSTTRMLEKD